MTPPPAPTIRVTQPTANEPRARVTITNGATLAALGAVTELEIRNATGPRLPSATDALFARVEAYPDGDATAVDTPPFPPGSRVWVRARSILPSERL